MCNIECFRYLDEEKSEIGNLRREINESGTTLDVQYFCDILQNIVEKNLQKIAFQKKNLRSSGWFEFLVGLVRVRGGGRLSCGCLSQSHGGRGVEEHCLGQERIRHERRHQHRVDLVVLNSIGLKIQVNFTIYP